MEQTLDWYLPLFSVTYNHTYDEDDQLISHPSTLSPVFRADFGSVTTKWKLKFGESNDGEGFWSFWLYLLSMETKPEMHVPKEIESKSGATTQITLRCQLILIAPPGKEDDLKLKLLRAKEISFGPTFPAEGVEEEIDFPVPDDFNANRAEAVVRRFLEWVNPSNDTLHIRVNLKCTKSVPSMTLASNGHLNNDLGGILASGQDSDVVIKCGQGPDLVTFPIHKLILSLRSPVFKSMLNSNMAEATSGVISIEDTEPLVMKQFLNFLYTENIEFGTMQAKDVIGLIAAGDKYQVTGCKDVCFQHLLTNLSSETCGHLAVAAYLHGADSWQKNLIYEYIAHHWSALGTKKDFQDLVKAYPAAFLKE